MKKINLVLIVIFALLSLYFFAITQRILSIYGQFDATGINYFALYIRPVGFLTLAVINLYGYLKSKPVNNMNILSIIFGVLIFLSPFIINYFS